MQKRDVVELWLHQWAGPRGLRAAVKASIAVLVALCVLIAGSRYLALGVALGIVAGLCSTPKPRYRRALGVRQLLVAGLGPAILIGAVEIVLFPNAGSQLTVIGALVVSGAVYLAVARRVGIGVSAAAIYLLIALFLFLLVRPQLAPGIALDLTAALLVGLVPGLLAGLTGLERDSERVAPRSPMQPIKESSEIGLALGLLAGAIGLVLPGRGAALADRISAGLAVGLVAGVPVGLGCGIFHYAFRFWLRTNDRAPLAWVGFLDWASVRLLLRTTGASYQWVHIELRDYLAAGYLGPNPTREYASRGTKRVRMGKVQQGSPRGNGQQSLPVSGGEE
jgi:hypothetical protein